MIANFFFRELGFGYLTGEVDNINNGLHIEVIVEKPTKQQKIIGKPCRCMYTLPACGVSFKENKASLKEVCIMNLCSYYTL